METIGIAIRAKANLEEVDAAAQKLERFGEASQRASSKVRQLVESMREGATTDINNLTEQIGQLQKKIQEPGLSQKERNQAKQQLTDLRDQVKEMKQLQRAKVDDYGIMESEARQQLEHLKNKRALTNAEKEQVKVLEEGLRYLEKYNKAKLDIDSLHLDKMQTELRDQDKEAEKSGIVGYGKSMVKRGIGMLVGGSIIAVAVQMMNKWADLDTQITKTGASLGGMSKAGVDALNEIGNKFGYTKEEALAFLEVYTSISGKMEDLGRSGVERKGFANLTEWGRVMGIGGEAMKLRELQRWGGEGVKPGTDQFFRYQFTALAQMLNMREGRMTEFVETSVTLVKSMERTFNKVSDSDIFRNIMLPSVVFGGADRGRGERGLSFMQRLNQGMTGGGDLMNLMMYRTIGVPTNWTQMWGAKALREQGAYGKLPSGDPAFIGMLKTAEGMFGGGKRYDEILTALKDKTKSKEEQDKLQAERTEIESKIMANISAAMPEMSAVEIQNMMDMFNGLKQGTWTMDAGKISPGMRDKLSMVEETKDLEKVRKKIEALKGNESTEIVTALKKTETELLEKVSRKITPNQIIEDKKTGEFTITGLNQKNIETILDIPKLVEKIDASKAISAGERWKVAIENMQFSIGGIFGPTMIGLLTGLARGVDSIASRFVGTYKSQTSNLDYLEKQGRAYFEKAGMIQFPKEITQENLIKMEKKVEAATGKKPGDQGYQTPEKLMELEQKIKEYREKLSDPSWLLTREYAGSSFMPEETKSMEIFGLNLNPWQNLIYEKERKGWIGKRAYNSFATEQEKEKIIAELSKKYPDMPIEEIGNQVKYAESLIKSKADAELDAAMKDYHKVQTIQKTMKLEDINANYEYNLSQEGAGFKRARLSALKTMYETDLERLGDLEKMAGSDASIQKPTIREYPGPYRTDSGGDNDFLLKGIREDLGKMAVTKEGEANIFNARELRVDRFVIGSNPFENFNRQSLPPVIKINIEGGGGDIRNVQYNRETGETTVRIGATDNY